MQKKRVNRDPRTKTASISIHTLKPNYIRPKNRNKINFDAHHTETKLISIQILNQVIFDSTQRQINSDPYTWIKSVPIPHTEIKFISTTHTTTKSVSMSILKPCHFSARVIFVLYIRVHVPVIQQRCVSHKYDYQLVLLFLTCRYRSKPPKILRKYRKDAGLCTLCGRLLKCFFFRFLSHRGAETPTRAETADTVRYSN